MRVCFLDNGDSARRASIETALQRLGRALGVAIPTGDWDGKPLTSRDILVFLGALNGPDAATGAVAAQLEVEATVDGRVLTVVARPKDFGATVPSAYPNLTRVNALFQDTYGNAWADAVADEVAARLFLKRRARKVFLSYRRDDSLQLARQLRDQLTRRRFDIFLDEVSLEPTIDFQRALKAWLLDADLVIVLASPRFEESRWTMEEIALAGSANVGMISVTWPAEVYAQPAPALGFAGQPGWPRPSVEGTTALADERFGITLSDLVPPNGVSLAECLLKQPQELTLKPDAVERLVGHALRARTRAIRSRLEGLLAFARHHFPSAVPTDELGDLEVETAAGTELVRVVPFRPTAITFEQAWRDAHGCSSVALYYSEVEDSLDLASLRWLASGVQQRAPTQLKLYTEVGGKVLQ